MKDRGIDFIEIDITRDGEAARQVRAWANGYETTPTFNIKGTIIVNFVKERLDRALASLSNPDSL
jgi:glutaredoxin